MIRELTQNLDIISELDNEPNDTGGLTPSELKAKFDESGNTIKAYINATLIPDVSDTIDDEINNALMKSGNVPKGGTAGQMLVKNTDADFDLKYADLPDGAAKLNTARTIQTDLESDTTSHFDGTEDVLLGVTGILQPSNGGTGASSAGDAALALGRGLGICTTAAATAAKTVSLSGFARITGAVIGVTFTNMNTVASPTLNVNETGAAAIIDSVTGVAVTKDKMAAKTHFFQFDGTNWILLNPTEWKHVTGTATGSFDSSAVTITLGFTPVAVIAQFTDTSASFNTMTFANLTLGTPATSKILNSGSNIATLTPTSTGFTLTAMSSGNPAIKYIAFV